MTIDYKLAKGSHGSREAGMCAMEWVSYIAGESHSDQPRCVSPVLQKFCISFNDALPDDKRQRLRPYLTRCIGTAGDGRDEERAWMATDWLIREFTPPWLDLAGLHVHAQNLRSLGRVLSPDTVERGRPTIDRARKDAAVAGDAAWAAAVAAARDAAWAVAGAAAWAAARDAAWDAAWAAAGEAAWAAARDAARDAAWDAARAAAVAVAGAAAWAAARDAAWDAAWAAARDALAPTRDAVIDSAFDLLDRMLPTEQVEIPEPFKAELERLCAA